VYAAYGINHATYTVDKVLCYESEGLWFDSG